MMHFSVWYGSFSVVLCGTVPFVFALFGMVPYGLVICVIWFL